MLKQEAGTDMKVPGNGDREGAQTCGGIMFGGLTCQAATMTAGSARPILPAVFAIHPRRFGEPYNARSLGGGFSKGTRRSKCEV